jgi:hypothetical protein
MLLRNKPVSSYEQQFANLVLLAALVTLALFGALYQGTIRAGMVNLYINHLALNFLCAPAIAVVMFYVGRYNTSFTRFLSSPMLVALGDTSYSIYLVHTWTLRLFNHPAPAWSWIWGLDAVFRILVAIALTLVVSYATYHLVEVPGRVWLRRKLGGAIAAGFADVEGARRPTAASPGALVSRSGSAPRARFAFSFAAIVLLASIAVIGQEARSLTVWSKVHRLWVGDRPEIEVLSATFGLNCQNAKIPAPYPNLVAPGNVTNAVKRTCDATGRCEYRVNISTIGDPANGCGKDFSVEYKCTGSEVVKLAFLPREAEGKSLILECGAAK